MNSVIVGDCRDELPRLPAASVNLAIADPVYNIGYDYLGEYSDSLSDSAYLQFCEDWLSQIRRVLIPTGTFWLIISDEYVSELDVLAKRLGFFKRSHVIQYYTFGVNTPTKFTRSHVHCLYYVKHKSEFVFNVEALKVMSARQLMGDKRAKAGGRLPDSVWILRPQDLGPDGFAATSDTWHISRVAGTFNERRAGAANQLSEQLVGRMVRACSNPGDLVLDPMVGTGTVLAVAKKLDRQYIGFELSPKFAAIATQRLAEVKVGDTLAGPTPQGG